MALKILDEHVVVYSFTFTSTGTVTYGGPAPMPPPMPPVTTPEELAGRAADLIERQGWVQNRIYSVDGSVCTRGALMMAQNWGPLGELGEEVELRIRRLVNTGDVPSWNDLRSTTKRHVLRTLRRVAAGEGTLFRYNREQLVRAGYLPEVVEYSLPTAHWVSEDHAVPDVVPIPEVVSEPGPHDDRLLPA